MPAAPPRWQSPEVNENITDCLAGPGKIPIISQSYQPNLLPAHPLRSHPNCPLRPPPLCLPFASFTMLPCHPHGPPHAWMSAKPILLPASISSGLLLSSPSLLSLHSLVLHFLTPPQAVSSLIPQNSAPTQVTICPQFVPLQPQISWCPATSALMPPLSSYMSISGCGRLSFPPFLHPLTITLSPPLSHCTPILLPFLLFCLPIQWLSPFSLTAQSGEAA